MRTIQLNVSNDIFEKVISFLELFPKNKISISFGRSAQNSQSEGNDFIGRLAKSPKHIASETPFLSRDEANER